jgi:pseudouridine-5'-phosphate glycosidase
VLSDGLKLVDSKKISGKDVTPFLLDHFHRATHGQSLVVNTDIIVRNADLAARIAVANSLVMKQA